ncbi:hypothetical protein [Natronococcus wangiae]|uniref:hypothetical protein n=1 Tax=Natronococcus wangiae TaxID=3068275 RepID=UPI00273EE4AE|nr:hypothetical protein [Natronococcus sp. AD5]
MYSDQHPIPREALPPGWGLVERCDGYLAYRHARLPIELVADRTPADGSHPGLGLGRYWELTYRYSLEDRSITESIGRVSTRQAAVKGILECMSRVHDRVENPSDPVEIQGVLEGVVLSDYVPDDRSAQ